MSDDEFVFGDDEDESLFGSSDGTANDGERRFGTSDETDSAPAGRGPLGEATKTVAAVVLGVALVVAAGIVAYPLVMGAFDASGPTDERAPGDGGGSVGTSTPTTTDQPVTQIVVTVEETTTERPKSTTRRTGIEPSATTTMADSPATQSTTERTTVPVNEFPAGEPADENETTAEEQSAGRQSAA
jgi:hypothetical protein